MRLLYEPLTDIPVGFTEVEYLEGTGTQYIDTGFKGNEAGKITAVVQSTDTAASSDGVPVGCGSGNERIQIYGGKLVSQYWSCRDDGTVIQSTTAKIVDRTTITLDTINKVCIFNNETRSYTASGSITSNNLLLFRRSYGTGGLDAAFIGRIYRVQIWNKQNILVRDFVPCLDNNNVPCMYDKVGGKAYYNAGTGSFNVGSKIIPVEYLETTPTAYIDTGIKGDLNTEIESISAVTTGGSNGVTNIAGNNKNSSKAITINVPVPAQNQATSRIRFGDTNTSIPAATISLNAYYKYTTNKNTFTAYNTSGEVVYTYDFNATTSFETESNIMIGMLDDTGAIYRGTVIHKNLKITKNGSLVRDFIPCKDENDVGFMFDKVTHSAYLNAGTGSFTFGKTLPKKKLRLIKESKRRLPKGFTEVEYLQSSGTQYIDTGVKPNNNTSVLYNCAVIGNITNKDSHLFGSRLSASSQAFDLAYMNTEPNGRETIRFISGDSYTQVKTSLVTATTIQNNNAYYMSSTQVKVNGTQVLSFTTQAYQGTYNLWLFGVNNAGTLHNQVVAQKVYACKIFENSVLVRDFIPCLDNDNTPCMYDLVEGKAYYNAGTGTFSYGHTITPVAYIQSSGTQYIDTGMKGNGTTKVEIKYQYPQLGSSAGGSGRIFGSRTSASQNNLSFGSNSGNLGTANDRYFFGYNNYDTRDVASTLPLIDTQPHTFYYNNAGFKIDGTVYWSRTAGTFTTPTNMKIFGFDQGGTMGYGRGRAYYCKIWNSTTLVRDYIPCKDENGVGYMFDVVTHTLYANAGTGSFVVGSEYKDITRFLEGE